MNPPSQENLVDAVTQALRKILIFRGKTELADAPITSTTDPVVELGIPSEDLVLVGPELSVISPDLDLPNEVFDWADDSSGQRRYRTVGEIADRMAQYLAAPQEAPHG